MEPANSALITKKLCKMARVVIFMIKRGKIIRKAVNDLMIQLQCCRSRDMHVSFREYEFSCSNTPYNSISIGSRRKGCGGGGGRYLYGGSTEHVKSYYNVNATIIPNNVYGNNNDVAAGVSPLVGPVGRVVRVTDSPFPLRDDDKADCHVDKAAEEFIQRFYKQLRLQKWKTTPEAGYLYR